MKALIFGANGQDGRILSEFLSAKGIKVIPVSRSGDVIIGDVSDRKFVFDLISTECPDYIFHLAANSTASHDAMFENHETISTGSLNILESVRTSVPKARVFLSGSGLQFKNVGLPINEDTPFEGNSPYAVSRIHSTFAGRYYRDKFDIKVYVGYLFNHDSKFRSERHVNMKVVSTAKRIAQGSDEKLVIGNLKVQKEFNYADDIVEAIWLLVTQDVIFEAVLGGGISYSIKDWIITCFNIVNLDWRDYVEIKEEYVSEYDILVSYPETIKKLGWQPRTNFSQLAHIMMEGLQCRKRWDL